MVKLYHLIYISLAILLVLLPVAGTADAYYYNNKQLNFTWQAAPLVCVWDSDYNRHAEEAIEKWQRALVNEFGEQWYFYATVITPYTTWEVIEQCGVHIVFIEVEYASLEDLYDEKDGVVGGRMLDRIDNVWIYVYEAKNWRGTLEAFDDLIITTTMHEIGHALGLGHVIAENQQEKLKPWPKTIMWPWGGHDTHKTIYQQDLDNFKCLYYNDNWLGNEPDRCLQYPTSFPDRPDPITGEHDASSFSAKFR